MYYVFRTENIIHIHRHINMLKPGSTYADMVSKYNEYKPSNVYIRRINETAIVYIERIKKIIESDSPHGPFDVFNVTRNNDRYAISARNIYVAKYFAVVLSRDNERQCRKAAENDYVKFAVSDPEEEYLIGIRDDMDLREASDAALQFYRKMNPCKSQNAIEWINATVSRTLDTRETEGLVTLQPLKK
jgi:hypothetical protein